jgi:hypothetical protein
LTVYGIGYMHITSSLLISIGVVSRYTADDKMRRVHHVRVLDVFRLVIARSGRRAMYDGCTEFIGLE